MVLLIARIIKTNQKLQRQTITGTSLDIIKSQKIQLKIRGWKTEPYDNKFLE